MELLKYFRLSKNALFSKEKVSATALLNEGCFAIGTESGMLHVLTVSGVVLKSYKAHDCKINDISVDSYGMVICCSDNGTVVIYTNINIYQMNDGKYQLEASDEKPTIVHFSEPIKSVCLEISSDRLMQLQLNSNAQGSGPRNHSTSSNGNGNGNGNGNNNTNTNK